MAGIVGCILGIQVVQIWVNITRYGKPVELLKIQKTKIHNVPSENVKKQ